MKTDVFLGLSLFAIVAGGLLSAFSARKPTRATAWTSAYLVLVVGVIQFGLITLWQKLAQPQDTEVLAALLIYNLGSSGVIAGTLLKKQLSYYQILVNAGGMCIGLAMILLLVAARYAKASWALAAFTGLVVVILISMPAGLVLSARRHPRREADGQLPT